MQSLSWTAHGAHGARQSNGRLFINHASRQGENNLDNFRFDLTSEGDLVKPMEIAFQRATRRAEGYLIDDKKGLVFFWYLGGSAAGLVPLPFKMDHVGAADFAKRWLAEQNYGNEPDHDGDNGKGWRLYNEAWGKIGDWTGSFIAVKPAWAMYGK